MAEYTKRFEEYGKHCAQYLITPRDFNGEYNMVWHHQRNYFLDNVICIYNEDDLKATEEIVFGDNDILTAILAPKIYADIVVMFSDPGKKLGTGGGNSKGKAQKELAEAGIPLEIINGRYEFSDGECDSKYRPKIRTVLEKYNI